MNSRLLLLALASSLSLLNGSSHPKATWRQAILLHSSKAKDDQGQGQVMLVELAFEDSHNIDPALAILEHDLLSGDDWAARDVTLHECWYVLRKVPESPTITWVLRNVPHEKNANLSLPLKTEVERLIISKGISKRIAVYPALDHALNSGGKDVAWAKSLLPKLLEPSPKESNQASVLAYEFLTQKRVE